MSRSMCEKVCVRETVSYHNVNVCESAVRCRTRTCERATVEHTRVREGMNTHTGLYTHPHMCYEIHIHTDM